MDIQADKLVLYGKEESSWNLLWLRDNCRCPHCWYTETAQRQLNTLRLISSPELYSPRSAHIEDHALVVSWLDGHRSIFSLGWLRAHAQKARYPLAKLQWRGPTFSQHGEPLPELALKEVQEQGSAGVDRWLTLLQKYGFVIIDGVEPEVGAMRAVVESIGPLFDSMFGDVWDISQIEAGGEWEAEHRDTAYSNGPIGPHTDGCYSWAPPGVQFFQIATTARVGGANYLVDGFQVASALKRQSPEAYELLARTPISYHYDDSTQGNHLKATHPVFSHDENGDLLRFHFNDSDRLPFACPPDQMASFYRAYGLLLGLLNDPVNRVTLQLRPDQLLASDNWRVLHARESFSGTRRLMGAYLERDTYSRRLLASKSKLPRVTSKRLCTHTCDSF